MLPKIVTRSINYGIGITTPTKIAYWKDILVNCVEGVIPRHPNRRMKNRRNISSIYIKEIFDMSNTQNSFQIQFSEEFTTSITDLTTPGTATMTYSHSQDFDWTPTGISAKYYTIGDLKILRGQVSGTTTLIASPYGLTVEISFNAPSFTSVPQVFCQPVCDVATEVNQIKNSPLSSQVYSITTTGFTVQVNCGYAYNQGLGGYPFAGGTALLQVNFLVIGS
jgi:hypothetical protein